MTLAFAPSPTDHYAVALGHKRFEGRVVYCNELTGLINDVAADITAKRCDVVVLGPALDVEVALLLTEAIDRDHPHIAVVMLSAELSPEIWELALEAGVHRILAGTATVSELLTTVEAALERIDRRTSKIAIDLRERIKEEVAVATPTRTGRVITVLSPKGGSGKTTVATNLAAGLAKHHPERVAIVDLDLQFGDVADALFLAPSHTLADIPSNDVSAASVKLALTPTDHGLFALCAPDDPATGEQIPPDAVGRAIDTLAADLDFVVVDTGAGVDAAALAAIERSTDLVFVGSLDVPSVRSVRKLLVALDRLGMSEARRHVVLNRADSDVGIAVDEVASTLDMPIAIQLPSSRLVPASINAGAPLVVSDPNTGVARPLFELVSLFTNVAPAAPKRRRGLSWKGSKK
jgi:pilus assembly protein CpaE